MNMISGDSTVTSDGYFCVM